ncbi:hypothetical protein AaE_007836, partial [Aphanomyces astaci]
VLEAIALPTSVSEGGDGRPFRVSATIVSLIGAFAMAVTFKDLSVLMGFVGATGDIMLNFAVPGMFLIEVGTKTNDRRSKWLGSFLLITGIVMAILSLIGLLA